MPVEKFRSVEDMSPPAPLPVGPERARVLRSLWGGWARLLPALDVRGVRKYRGVEEADRDHERAVRRRMECLWRERRGV